MRIRQGVSLGILGAIHLVFLLTLIFEPTVNLGIKALVLSSLVFLIVAYVRAPRTNAIHPKNETLLYPFIISLAAVLTYFVSVDLHFGPVIASAGIGFVVSYFTKFKSSFMKTVPVPIYCGTFVGMCSSFHAEDYFFVAYAGLISGVIYILTRDTLNGIGGKLGSIALGGVVFVSFIFSLL